MNKKGFTLVELIVAIGLLSIMMLFMYSFFADITFEQEDESYVSLNQEQRIEIEEYITKHLNNHSYTYKLNNKICFSDYIECENNKLCSPEETIDNCHDYIEITKKNNSKEYNTISVYISNKVQRTWTMKNSYIGQTKCENYIASETEKEVIINCSIKIHTENIFNQEKVINETLIDNNNTIDDIIIAYVYKQ